ncbi:MAG: amidase family protein [Bacilli bacterium]|nr:amidase family protein [Bacilli bacterium]MDY6363034.1 amidase family protein [Bacilli bacterium]
MNYRGLSIDELHALLVAKKVTPLELAQEALALAKKDSNNAFEYIMEKEALDFAASLTEPEENNPLWGIPFVIKDNFSTKDVPTTGSSNILKGYVPVFDATVVEKLKAAKAVAIGKTTLDELAMGGTGTSGHLGMTFNPYDRKHERLVGGSSCGSAAVTADGFVPFALGSDTGDSTRKPASYAGLVGFKPTWSRISRYGLFPFAPSLDTVGIFSRNVKDSAYVLDVLAGHDDRDFTSSVKPVDEYAKDIEKVNPKAKIAVIKGIVNSISNKVVLDKFNETIDMLKNAGFTVDFVEIDEKILSSLFPTYFVISCAEATSNNANMDGIKFGPYYNGQTFEDVVSQARTNGFGELIKRRFIIGNFALMKENQKDLFLRAQKNRRVIVNAVNDILKEYDFIYCPAAPSIAPKVGEKSDRLSNEYLIADNHLVIANFAGLPSITLPIGMKDGMPFGANFTGRAFEDKQVLQIAYELEKHTGLKNIVAKGE